MYRHVPKKRALVAAMVVASTAMIILSLPESVGTARGAQDDRAPTTTTQRCEKVVLELCVLQDDMAMLDQGLNEKVMVMQYALPEQRLEAIERVVQELVDQRREILDKLKRSHQNVLIHLMQHIQCGESIETCPMMSFTQRHAPARQPTRG